MTETIATGRQRIQSLDILRGIVMILMALDHVRDYFHVTAHTDDPMNLATTTPFLFFTRWITHFCAPAFVFLAGASAYLMGLKKTKAGLSAFLIKRGLWLILAEITVVSLGWSFNPYYPFFFLQVIWAIGVGMILLGIMVWLPYPYILAAGLIIITGHNLLDGVQGGILWDFAHNGHFVAYRIAEGHTAVLIYPFLPWAGLMMAGYGAGKLYSPAVSATVRKKILVRCGLLLTGIFILLRFTNFYGDPEQWTTQKNTLYTIFSFVDVSKYPPSFLFVCMTIGPALLLLALLENARGRLADIVKVYGRVPFIYYIAHLYLAHALAAAVYFFRGHTLEEAMATSGRSSFLFVAPGEGYNLGIVYGVWLLVVISLYPLCRWFDRYKSRSRKWWLSYL